MNILKRKFSEFRKWFLEEASVEKQFTTAILILGVIGSLISGIAKFIAWVDERNRDPITIVMPERAPGVFEISLDEYESRITTRIAEAEAKLQTAHEAEKAELIQQIDVLKQRAANPETALAHARETIAKLEGVLQREGNEIGEARMAEARTALEDGDFTLADDIFAEIEAREHLAVERTARAAFARGEIAKQEVRLHDAAKHYTRAAELHGTADHLMKAFQFLYLTGDHDSAEYFSKEMIPAVIKDYGADTPKHASALSNLAGLYRVQGKYDQAEPLYLQAIEISTTTLGEAHPDYATRLNSLAELYHAQGKYDQAEPLYLQAIEISTTTLGEAQPYAFYLINLAGLYHAQGKYDQAEPLYLQAIEIVKGTRGETQPYYAVDLTNLAELYRALGKYDQAEPLYLQAIEIFDATLGADHPHTKAMRANYERLLAAKG